MNPINQLEFTSLLLRVNNPDEQVSFLGNIAANKTSVFYETKKLEQIKKIHQDNKKTGGIFFAKLGNGTIVGISHDMSQKLTYQHHSGKVETLVYCSAKENLTIIENLTTYLSQCTHTFLEHYDSSVLLKLRKDI